MTKRTTTTITETLFSVAGSPAPATPTLLIVPGTEPQVTLENAMTEMHKYAVHNVITRAHLAMPNDMPADDCRRARGQVDAYLNEHDDDVKAAIRAYCEQLRTANGRTINTAILAYGCDHAGETVWTALGMQDVIASIIKANNTSTPKQETPAQAARQEDSQIIASTRGGELTTIATITRHNLDDNEPAPAIDTAEEDDPAVIRAEVISIAQAENRKDAEMALAADAIRTKATTIITAYAESDIITSAVSYLAEALPLDEAADLTPRITAYISARRDKLAALCRAYYVEHYDGQAPALGMLVDVAKAMWPLIGITARLSEILDVYRAPAPETLTPTLEPDQEQEPETPQRGRAANKPTRLTADGRILIKFDARPSLKTRAMMRENHFAWAPTRGAWVRMDNERGRDAADKVMAALA